jgi:hypothetical protein
MIRHVCGRRRTDFGAEQAEQGVSTRWKVEEADPRDLKRAGQPVAELLEQPHVVVTSMFCCCRTVPMIEIRRMISVTTARGQTEELEGGSYQVATAAVRACGRRF